MRRIIHINSIIIGILIVSIGITKAQYVLKEADQQFQLYNYDKAVELYLSAYERKKSIHSVERLAESYTLMRNFKQAENWYSILIGMEGAKPEAFKAYAEMLQQNSKYNEAKIYYAKYADLNKAITQTQLNRWYASCDSALKWIKYPKAITILNEKSLNSPQSDWGVVKYGGDLIFSSDRIVGNSALTKTNKPFLKFDVSKLPDHQVYGWLGNQYLRLYTKSNGSDTTALFPLKTSSEYHISSASFSADGNEVYFAQTLIPKTINRIKGSPTTINIEIFSSKKENNVWGEPLPFRYNNAQQYSVGDPFLAKDGKLYFVANLPGGKGGTDIYYCTRNADGSWADAINMAEVNTPGNERTPSIDNNDTFYFASDGNIGMGGLDIFSLNLNSNNASVIKNLGYPINSPQDDFAYHSTSKLTGYFASNRDGGVGSDDVYSFIEKEKIIEKPIYALKGTVFNKETNQPIAESVVSLYSDNQKVVKVKTDQNGAYNFNLAEKSAYAITAEKPGFMKSTSSVTTVGLTKSEVLERNLYLSEIVIGKAIRIDNIFYDFDKFNIRPDAALELDKLVSVLKENPTIWIELGSHTDSRGNDLYNLKLSQNRASSAVQYIISKGISKERITAKGYGETMLVNQCKNGAKCTDEEHQLNRRTEFKITRQ
jgi:peptidoglycan-associated lipoprotein